jgi:hypothetical protein
MVEVVDWSYSGVGDRKEKVAEEVEGREKDRSLAAVD